MTEYSKALEFLQKALEIRQQSQHPNQSNLAASYRSIAVVHCDMGEYSKALEFYQKTLEIQQKTLPPNHSNLAATYRNIASVHDKMGEYRNALLFYERALEFYSVHCLKIILISKRAERTSLKYEQNYNSFL